MASFSRPLLLAAKMTDGAIWSGGAAKGRFATLWWTVMPCPMRIMTTLLVSETADGAMKGHYVLPPPRSSRSPAQERRLLHILLDLWI
ncbi:hypothetical protein SESBI_45686 [Sesbania bispinosa]|nr:hypothetical protein SESBI_45686 [Sesbania bispinosa]